MNPTSIFIAVLLSLLVLALFIDAARTVGIKNALINGALLWYGYATALGLDYFVPRLVR